jgi:hypothetical protein
MHEPKRTENTENLSISVNEPGGPGGPIKRQIERLSYKARIRARVLGAVAYTSSLSIYRELARERKSSVQDEASHPKGVEQNQGATCPLYTAHEINPVFARGWPVLRNAAGRPRDISLAKEFPLL